MKGLITLFAVLVVLGVAFFLYSTPSAPPEMTEAERAQQEAQVRQEISRTDEGFRDAVLRGDPQAAASVWTSDARLLEPGVDVTGSDFQGFFEEAFATMDITEYDLEILELFLHGDVAYAIYQETATAQVVGQEPFTMVNNAFVRLEKENGTWKYDRIVSAPRDAPSEG